MTPNDTMRRVRYIFDLDDAKMIAVFALGGCEVTRADVSDWLKKEEDPAYRECTEKHLASFLNGLIIEKRGRRDGPPVVAEARLTNNLILTKLRIALELTGDDLMEVMALANHPVSKHEMSALFRKPGSKHYRECLDQILRNFLNGLQARECGS